jgi:hypothetical protein
VPLFLALAAVVLAGCAPERSAPAPTRPGAELGPRDASARYLIRFAGAPVGIRELALRRVAGGFELRRRDELAVMREGTEVSSSIGLVIELDPGLRARRVEVASAIGVLERRMVAVRERGGWTIARRGGRGSRIAGLDITEAALLRQGELDAVPVLAPEASFARVELSARPLGGGRREIVLASPLGSSRTVLADADDGLPAWWRSDSGESGERIEGMAPAIEPVELIDLAAMPMVGKRRWPRPRTLRIRRADRPPPPAVGGQQVVAAGGDWIIGFSRPPPVPRALADLVRAVDAMVVEDSGLPGLGAEDALRMGRGDCTGHAAALASVARDAGWTAQLATGYRRAGERWIRHRWVVVTVGGREVFLDPSFAEAPSPPGKLLALSVHGDGADEIALADLITFRGMGEAVASDD